MTLWLPRQRRIIQPRPIDCEGLGLGLGFGGGGPSFTPINLGSIAAWGRADLGVTDTSGKASAILDQAGTGDANKNYAQSNAALRPTISASDAAYNNQAVLVWGAGITMPSGTWSTPIAQPFSWFVIGNDSGAAGSEYYLEGNISGASRSILGGEVITPGYATYSGTELKAGSRSNAPRMLGGINDNSGTSSLFINSMTPVITTGAGNIGTGNISALTVGSSFAGTASNLGKIAEWIVVAGIVTAPELSQLRGYFNNRYGLGITA